MPLLLAAGDVPQFLTDLVALLAVAAGVAYACHRLGLVPIVGFLLAGVVIGPHGLGLVSDPAVIDAAAELGVLLLLFTIGIEFSLEKLARITRLIVVGGGLQVVLVTAAVALVLLPFGVGWRAGVFSGFLAALSSTAIVTKLLGDRGETGGAQGQAALGVLIFQDLAVVVMVLLVPALAGAGSSGLDVVWALGKAGLIIAAVLVFARRLLPPLLEAVARTCSPDLFLLTVIALCMGTAWLVGMAGVSIALGAFLAGLVVSESHYAEHAFAEILPLQILFSATFFVSIGLLLDVMALVENLPLVLLVIAAVVALKLVTTGVALRAAGVSLPVAGGTALLLAQVGEFSFVLERSGRAVGLAPLGMGEVGSQTFIAASVVLMVLTPLFAAGASRLGRRIEHAMLPDEGAVEPGALAALDALRDHVVVAGWGPAGRALARVLRAARIPVAVGTLSPDGALEAEREGLAVLRGDYAKRHILERLGVPRAKLLVVPDDETATAVRVTSVARSLAPTTRIVVRAAERDDAEALERAGADRAIAAGLEAVVGLVDDVLRGYQVEPELVLRHEESLRRGNYELLESAAVPDLPCELAGDCGSTRTLVVRAGTPLAGRALGELELERRGLAVRSVEREGERRVDPAGDTVLAPGAVVTIAGTAAALESAAELFRGGAVSAAPPEPAQVAAWIDTSRPLEFAPDPGAGCTHLDRLHPVAPRTQGCAECLALGHRWVHLRACLECGHVGCCDSSPGRHASAHFRSSGHPLMCSLEPGESWGWCHVDGVQL